MGTDSPVSMDWSSSTDPVGQAHVGGNHGAERQFHDVARHQFGRGHRRPGTIAPDRRIQRQPRLQRGKRRLSAPFLEEPESRVEDQQSRR